MRSSQITTNTVSVANYRSSTPPKANSNFNLQQFQSVVTQRQSSLNNYGSVVDARYDDGGRYRGTLQGEMRVGRGDYTFPNGDYYNGFWQNDMFNGVGLYRYKNSQKAYFGEFLNNQPHGRGALTIDGQSPVIVYEGQWEQGVKHGKGIEFYSHSPQQYYEGSWVRGFKAGFGTYCYPDGSIYKGQWLNNKKHGKGEFTTKDGVTLNGIWNNDVIESNVPINIQYLKNIPNLGPVFDSYEGNHIGGARNGQGVYRFYNGSEGVNQYIGDYRNNRRFGMGTYTTSFGDRYIGGFSEGKKHGQEGKYLWADGSSYTGVFEGDGIFNGIFTDSKDGQQRTIVNGKVQMV